MTARRASKRRKGPKGKVGRWGVAPQLVAAILILGLLGAMAIKPTRDLLQQKSRVAGIATELQTLQKSNNRLEHRIAKLKDPDYIDQLARREIGLVRPGEVPYVVMPPGRRAQAKRAHRAARSRPSDPQIARPSFVQKVLHFIGIG